MLKSQQPTVISKIARYPSKRSYHFSAKSKKWPFQQSEITQLTSFSSAQSKQLSYDSCDNYLMIAVTAFPDSWNSLFRTAVTANLVAWTLLIFPHLVKTKTNYWNYLSLMITIIVFPNRGDSLFRTAVLANLVAWTLLIFPHLAKTKTKYWNYLSLAEIPSFSVALSPAALIWNSNNILKLNIPFLAKS